MPKLTAKYRGALQAAALHGIEPRTVYQEELYARLQQAGCFWDSHAKRWESHDIEDADEPTPMIMVRLWAEGEIIEEVADDIIAAIKRANLPWRLTKRSTPYANRPPKQKEARVYLEFLPGPRDGQ